MALWTTRRSKPVTAVRLGVHALEDRLTPSNTFTGLGAASSYGVLAFNNGTLNLTNANVTGDVGVGNNGDMTARRSTLDGTVFLGSRVHTQFGSNFAPTGGVERADVQAAVADARAASRSFGNLAPNRTFQVLDRSLSLTGNGGTNVYRLRGFDYRNDTLTLNGGANDRFVFNVTGDFSFRNSRMVLNGVSANQVLFNFTSADADVSVRNESSVVFGTFLAPRGDLEFRGIASFEGAVLARDVSFLAGATLDNGSEDPPVGGNASLSGSVFYDFDFSGSRDEGENGVGGFTLTLSGTTSQGQNVTFQPREFLEGDPEGFFEFVNLPAGTYTLTVELQPDFYVYTGATAGTTGGSVLGNAVLDIVLGDSDAGLDYNFGMVGGGGS